jgi:hypothetical protein
LEAAKAAGRVQRVSAATVAGQLMFFFIVNVIACFLAKTKLQYLEVGCDISYE